jgi:uncharacterized membrane protein
MKKIIAVICLSLFVFPFVVMAEEAVLVEPQDTVFKARVVEIIEEQEITRESGNTAIQQHLKLEGLEGDWKFKKFEVNGIGGLDVVGGVESSVGNKVIVTHSINIDGSESFIITDFVRLNYLYFLVAIFIILMVGIARWTGVKAIGSLALSFVVIMWFVIPRIIAGSSPLLISLLGAIVILALVIYIHWGFKMKAHIATVSIFISLLLTGLISIIFTNLTKLSGLADDNVLYLVGQSGVNIQFEGLLLAGIIIGTLGVLDDVVISQVSIVEQLKEVNPKIPMWEAFRRGMKIGVDHLSSMTNTLFLAYAGASLPLLLLFHLRQEPFMKISQILNNQMIATEIVRTLVGSIGLILAVPIATFFAAYYLKGKKEKN